MKKQMILILLFVFCMQISVSANMEFAMERYKYAYPCDMAYNGEVYAAVSGNGDIMTSIDLENWTQIETKQRNYFSKIYWTGTQFIIESKVNSGTEIHAIFISQNGYDWERIDTSSDISVLGIGATGDEIFFKKDQLLYVSDSAGNAQQVIIDKEINELMYSNGCYLAFPTSRAEKEIIFFSSADKEIWTEHKLNLEEKKGRYAVSFKNGLLSFAVVQGFKLKVYSSAGDFSDWREVMMGEGDFNKLWALEQEDGNHFYYRNGNMYGHISTSDGTHFESFGDDYQLAKMDLDQKGVFMMTGERAIATSKYTLYTIAKGGTLEEFRFPDKPENYEEPQNVTKVLSQYLRPIDGTMYLTGRIDPKQKLYDLYAEQPVYDTLYKEKSLEYIQAGDNYMAFSKSTLSEQASKVYLFDASLAQVKEKSFDQKVVGVSYFNGFYYCYLEGEKYRRSGDFETWEEIQNTQYPDVWGTCKGGSKTFNGTDVYQIKLEDQSRYYGQSYERVGEWKHYGSREYSFFTNDDVYFVRVDIPPDWNPINGASGIGNLWYETEDYLISRHEPFLYKVPKQALYEKLHDLKNNPPPYIVVNENVLAFEQPPVMESDRTLVPMRFLFENLGADVTWDESTQRATASVQSTAVTFGINDTTSEVNGQPVTMDVPARLINDQTFVPLRFLSEELGYEVTWDNDTRVVTIN